jgi:hypothetical protein
MNELRISSSKRDLAARKIGWSSLNPLNLQAIALQTPTGANQERGEHTGRYSSHPPWWAELRS